MGDWPRHNVRRFPIGPHHHAEMYWRDDPAGQGWAVSFYGEGVEVLRLDLFPGKAHEHFAGMPGQPRLYMPRFWQSGNLVRLAVSNLVEHAPVACDLAGVSRPARNLTRTAARDIKATLLEVM